LFGAQREEGSTADPSASEKTKTRKKSSGSKSSEKKKKKGDPEVSEKKDVLLPTDESVPEQQKLR
jgi:hypothetical protein